MNTQECCEQCKTQVLIPLCNNIGCECHVIKMGSEIEIVGEPKPIEEWEKRLSSFFCKECREDNEHRIVDCEFNGYEGLIGLTKELLSKTHQEAIESCIQKLKEFQKNE